MSLCGDVDAAGIRMPLHRFAGTIRRNKHRDDRAHGRLQNLLAQNDVRAGEPSRRWEARWNKWKGQVGERASVLAAGTIAEGARDRTARDAGHMGGCDVAVLVIAPGRDEDGVAAHGNAGRIGEGAARAHLARLCSRATSGISWRRKKSSAKVMWPCPTAPPH